MHKAAKTKAMALALGACLLAGAAASAGILDGSGEPDPIWQTNSMLLWLKPDAGITTVGGSVSLWADQSTYGNDATQATAAYQPTHNPTGLNGQPAVLFDGNNRHMIIATPPTNYQTAFFVYKDASTQAWVTPLGTVYDGKGAYHGQSNDTGLFNTTYTDAKTRDGDNYRNGTNIGTGTTTPRPDNWALDAHVATGPLLQGARTVGADNNYGTSREIKGGIAEIILYDRALTDPEMHDVGYYLEQKYGLNTTYGPAELVSYWTFDDGTANDTVDGNHGTQMGSGVMPNAAGIVGKAMDYNDTTNAYITVPAPHTLNAATDATNQITMEAWIQPTEIETGHSEVMRQQSPGYRFISFQAGGVRIRFQLEGSNLDAVFADLGIDASYFEDGNWHHLAGTYDGTTQRFYIDGKEAVSKPVSLNLSSATPPDFVIGNYRGGYGEPFGGRIDEAAVWNEALSADEVKHHWINRQPYTSRLVVANPVIWDVHDDWDPTDGKPGDPPQRAWYYQKRSAGQYSDLDTWSPQWGGDAWKDAGSYPVIGPRSGEFDHPVQSVDDYVAAQGIDQMKLIHIHPDNGPEDAVVTWRNPLPGSNIFQFDGVFWHVAGHCGDGVGVSISLSEPFGLDDALLSSLITGMAADEVVINLNDSDPNNDNAYYSFRLPLNYGDEVHFRVNPLANHSCDSVMFGSTVTFIPEPTTMVLLLGGLGLLGRRRRRR